jgi:methyl-accepting chemotaxis protein
LLSVLSAFFLNKLSEKTGRILKENHDSVVFAREMSESLTFINQEILHYYLTNQNPDTLLIDKQLKTFTKSLELEKNNITEPGEDKLALNIENEFNEYSREIKEFVKSKSEAEGLSLQNRFKNLFQQINLLSQMNENAIEVKTGDAKTTAKNASIQMSIVAAICILVAFSFTYSFSSYFNERFTQLYDGIKEIVSSNYDQRLYFEGKDEFYEISIIFNEMAEKLSEKKEKMNELLDVDNEKTKIAGNIDELKILLARLKNVEEQANNLIAKFENKI